MMYAMYDEVIRKATTTYRFVEQISLLGCNVGLIPRLLRSQLSTAQGEPYLWHLNVRAGLKAEGRASTTVIIDAKPKNKKLLSLYELLDVWGNSDYGWTPLLLLTRDLFTDVDPKDQDRKDFEIKGITERPFVYSMLYASGSVNAGELVGTWNPPGPGSTNSLFLWKDTFSYFVSRINRTTPGFLG
jgi:hypothetical protein